MLVIMVWMGSGDLLLLLYYVPAVDRGVHDLTDQAPQPEHRGYILERNTNHELGKASLLVGCVSALADAEVGCS